MRSFIATAPAAYRNLIGAALTIAIEDARRDMARRSTGEPATVPDTLRDGAEEGNIVIAIIPMPEGEPFAEFLANIEDAVLAGHYDPAASTPGMKAAVDSFRRMTQTEGPPVFAPPVVPPSRRVVAMAALGAGETNVGLMESNPVVVLDDGRVFEMTQDRTWISRRPVPGTPADAEFQARVEAIGDIED